MSSISRRTSMPLARILRNLRSPDWGKRKAASIELLKTDRGAMPSIISLLKKESNILTKSSLIEFLEKKKDKRALPVLKMLLFDFDKIIRQSAGDALAEFNGWRNTIEFIKKRFRNPEDIPTAFFYSHDRWNYKRKFRAWNKETWASLKKQAMVEARKKGFKRMRKNGRVFSVKGVPVFLGKLPKGYLGQYTNGLMVIQANRKALDPRDREAVAWHEFGEIFSHEIGLAFQLDFFKRTGQLKGFLQRCPTLRKEFEEIEGKW